jgi:hypothetical protein
VERVLLEGGPDAERSLVIRFDGFIGSLIKVPDPQEGKMARLLPGMDLLRALMEHSDSFGTAAPGTGSGATLARQVLALTDGAFDAAHEILEAADPWGYYEEAPTPGLSALLSRLDPGLFEAVVRELEAVPAAEDRGMGGEFL